MRSLFWKIFLSFWLAQALFLVLAILVTLALRPPRDPATWEALQSKVLTEAVQAYENGGEQEAHQYLSDLEESQRIRAYLFNAAGEDVTGGRPPEWIKNMARSRVRPPVGLGRWFTRGRFLRQSTISRSGRHYTLIIALPPGPRVFFGPRGVPTLGLLIAVVSSGLVCFLLARYLTGPVTRLRAATQKLASGDLTARAGTAKGARRGDEIAQLVKDFDNMAERLEGLVKAQSRLLNDISHELRSPLARLNVALALARQRAGPDAQSVLDRIDLEG
ncbi:MAG TPA: HAMP domain-containing protein, partial [Terriglobales bacterium]